MSYYYTKRFAYKLFLSEGPVAFMPQATFRGWYLHIAGFYLLEVGDSGQQTIPAACGEVRQGSDDVHSDFPSYSAGSSHIPSQGPERPCLQHWIPGF